MRKALLIVLGCPLLLFGDDSTELTNLELGQNPAIYNSVNVTNGNYVEMHNDCVVSGAEPIPLQRTHLSSDIDYHPGLFRFDDERLFIRIGRHGFPHTIKLKESSGAIIQFIPPTKAGYHTGQPAVWECAALMPEGYANTSGGALSGKSHLQNAKLTFKRKPHYQFELVQGNGETRFYRCWGKRQDWHKAKHMRNSHPVYQEFVLAEIRRPNGNRLFYHYDNEERIVRIEATDPSAKTVLSWVDLHYLRKKGTAYIASVETSDGQTVNYHYDTKRGVATKIKRQELLVGVTINGQLKEQYLHDEHRIAKKIGPKGECLSIDYLHDGGGALRNHTANCFRVLSQAATVGPDGGEEKLATFSYDFGYKEQYGWTEVWDANRHLTRYHYDANERINLLEKFECRDGAQKLVGHECFFWEGHNLAQHVHTDADHNVLLCREFEYDPRGNVVTERLMGNLSGQTNEPSRCYPTYSWDQRQKKKQWRRIQRGVEYSPHVERYEKRYTYSDDGYNNLLSESYEDVLIRYDYLPDTDLVTTKYTTVAGNGTELEQFSYNPYGQLAHHSRTDFYRTVCKEITPCSVAPRIGLPEVIEEYVFEGSKQIPTKTERLHYSDRNLVVQRDIYDGEGTFRYSLYQDYDQAGNLIAQTDALGQVIDYQYDKSGNLIFKKTPTSQAATDYDLAGRPIHIETSDSNGLILTRSVRYDAMGNTIAEGDGSGNEVKTDFDREGRATCISHPPVFQNGQWVRPAAEKTYNFLGYLISETDERGFVTNHRYNDQGQVVTTLYPDGTLEHFTYTLSGFLATETDRAGITTRYLRDFRGRPLTVSVYGPKGDFLKETSHIYEGDCLVGTHHPDGTSTTYAYNSQGQLIQEAHEGAESLYEYDSLGQRIKKVEGNTEICWEYDLLERQTREEVCNSRVLTWRAFEYDFDGNQTCVSEGGAQTHTRYGLLGPVSVVDPLGCETHTSYNLHHPFNGQLTLQTITTDPLGNETLTTFDPRGNIQTVDKRNAFGSLLSQATFLYDLANHKIQENHIPLSAGTPSTPYVLYYTHDLVGNLVSMVEEGGDMRRTTTYTYDSLGRLASTIKPSGITLTRTYDSLGRLHTLSGPDFSDTYTYDLMDRLLQVTGSDGAQTSRSYDSRGHLTSETLANGHTVTFSRSLHGQITQLNFPDHSSISYTYDGPLIASLTRGTNTFTYRYDQTGRVVNFQSPVQNVTTRRDPLGRPVEIDAGSFTEQLTYDSVGNLTTRFSSDPLGVVGRSYHYDDLYQLTSDGDRDTTCNSLGNRLADTCDALNQLLESQGVRFTYDSDGQPRTQGPVDYVYDSQGRLTTIESETVKVTFTYDPFHRRLSKTIHTLRNETWAILSHLDYLYTGEDEVGAMERGSLAEFRPLGPGLGAEIGAAPLIELKGIPYFPLYDFRGSVHLLLDSAAYPMEIIRYTGFGESEVYDNWGRHCSASPIGNPYRFLSKRTDEESGLVFFGRRYYQPQFGRWLTPDPSGYEDGPHLYLYCQNSPLTHLDLRGLFARGSPQLAIPRTPRPSIYHAAPKDYASAMVLNYAHDRFYRNKTGAFSLNREPFPHGGKVMLINGINTSPLEARSNAEHLSDTIGGYNVTYVYNPTAGFALDVVRASAEIHGGLATAVVQKIHEEWDAFFATAPPWMTCLTYAHSEGAAILRNALILYDEELRERIIPILIAPAAYIWNDINSRAWHYTSTNDFVPLIDLMGRARCKDTTTVLPRVEGALPWDHPIKSPTYIKPIKDSGGDYSFDLKKWLDL